MRILSFKLIAESTGFEPVRVLPRLISNQLQYLIMRTLPIAQGSVQASKLSPCDTVGIPPASTQ